MGVVQKILRHSDIKVTEEIYRVNSTGRRNTSARRGCDGQEASAV
jgi:hypothetical protein